MAHEKNITPATNDSEAKQEKVESLPRKDEETRAEAEDFDESEDSLDFGGLPEDMPDMKRFLGCGG